MRKAYRVAYIVYSPKYGEVETYLNIAATSKDEIPKKIARLHPDVKTEVYYITELKNWDDYILDILWEAHETIYLRLWEPGISTTEMIRKLKKYYPPIWRGFYG